MDASERRLSQTLDEAQKCLTVYTNELMTNFWRLFAVVFGASILVSLLIVWLLIPRNPRYRFLLNKSLTCTTVLFSINFGRT
jgi:hypothetical protein